MRLPPLTLAVILPPLAVIPLYAVFMAVTHRIDVGTWIPAGGMLKIARALCFAYVIATIAHAIYRCVVFLVSRGIGVRHIAFWTVLYALPLAAFALRFSDTSSDLAGASIHVALAVILALVAWPFVRPALMRP